MKFFILFSIVLSSYVCAQNKSVYAEDSRKDYFEIDDNLIKDQSKAIAIQVDKKALLDKGDYYRLQTQSLRAFNYCSSFKFSNQYSVGKCTGFLVNKNKLLTSATCVKNQFDCDNNSWVFNYTKKSKYHNPITSKKEHVYKCKQILKRKYSTKYKTSFALIELTKEVLDIQPLELAAASPELNDNIYMIGSPHGLPLKLSTEANIKKIYKSFFKATVDAAKSNSGSPVFNSKSQVIGVYSHGPSQSSTRGDCLVPSKYNGKSGYEYITRTDIIIP